MSVVMTDSTRGETLSEDPNDFRRVLVQLWYPAQKPSDGDPVPYLGDELTFRLAKLHLMSLDIEGKLDRTQQAHGRPEAPVAEHSSPFPLLLFSPGLGVPAIFYRHTLEDLVSHGYAVAAINHPYFSGLTVFPDGRIIPSVEMILLPNGDLGSAAEQPEEITLPDDFNDTYFDDILLRDVQFVLDYLKGLAPDHDLYGRLDVSKFGIYGHSLGGVIATQAAREMPACKAAVNIDGWSADMERPATHPAVPLFLLFAEENARDLSEIPPAALDASQMRYLAVLEGSAHINFLDLPYLVDTPTSPSRDLGTVDPNALLQTTNAILLAFFDRYLKGTSTAASLDISNRHHRAEHHPVIAEIEPDTSALEGLHLAPATKHRIRLPKAVKKHAAPKPATTATHRDSSVSLSIPPPVASPEESPLLQSSLLETPKSIRGYIKDADTGTALPAATIQVIDDFKGFTGTIANEDGTYSLPLRALPAVLKITCIGYRSEELLVADPAMEELNIQLKPAPIQMDAVVVRAENSGAAIMSKVLEHKKKWRSMKSYRAEAYERQHLQKDTSIVAVREYVMQVFWDKENRRQLSTIRGLRGTTDHAQIMRGLDPTIYRDFYQDSVRLQGSTLMLPTHAQALDHYNFSLISQRYIDDKTVYDLSFEPKSRVNSGFIGTLSVLDEEYALLEIELQPSPSAVAEFSLASIFDLHWTFRQKFRPFEGGTWLPMDLQYEVHVDFLGLNSGVEKFKGTMQLTDYQIDIPLPDSIFANDNWIQIDALMAKGDRAFTPYPREEMLSKKELHAYNILGSATETEMTPLAKKTPDRSSHSPRLLPELWFNRVDAAHLGFNAVRPHNERINFYLNGAYKTGLKRWAYGGGFQYTWGPRQNGSIQIDYQRGSRRRYESESYPLPYNSVPALLGVGDYFDYYWSTSADLEVVYQLNKPNIALSVALRNQTHTSLRKSTNFDLRGRSKALRANPAVEEGHLRSIEWVATYGQEWPSWGQRPHKGAEIGVEYSSNELLSSDFSFTRYYLAVDWRLPTFFRHKAKPNTLDLRLSAGTSTGTLPIQRFGTLDTGLWSFAPFGAFRALRNRPYEGEKYLGLFWEHNFRTAPFEKLGLWGLARRQLSLSLYGASGKTWISSNRLSSLGHSPRYADDFHHEIGLSWSAMNLVRLDLTRRLDQHQWNVGFSISPIFNQR